MNASGGEQVMPDDDDAKRKAFEEARKEFDEEPAPKAAPPPQQQQQQPQPQPSLRVVPHGPKWKRSDWLPTGENVVHEVMEKYGADHLVAGGQDYIWTGTVWKRDERHMIERHCAEMCRTIGITKKKTIRKTLEGARFISGVSGRTRVECTDEVDMLDQAEVYNTPSSSVLLNCAALEPRPHDRADHCTMITSVPWLKGARAKRWLGFLEWVMAGDSEMIDYLQRMAGYWSSPFTSEQVFWFLYGDGGTGKGCFMRTIARVMGDYATVASLDFFLATKYSPHKEELAQYRGKRLVYATEVPKNRSWDEAKLKAITGGDRVRANLMRENSFEYLPNYKLAIAGNEQPKLGTVDEAIKRRLQLLPFLVQITAAERADQDFEARIFREEGAAILGWQLEGFEEWRRHRLSPPDKVLAAGAEYLEGQDELGQWATERCDIGDPNYFAFNVMLFEDWKEWANARGFRVGAENQLTTSLQKKFRNRGVDFHRKNNGRGLIGIRLKPKEYKDD